MSILMRNCGLLGTLMLLSGCANSIRYTVGESISDKRQGLEIRDQRSEVQKKSRIMSLSMSSCWFGIYRLGDDQTEPDRLAMLRDKLEARLGASAKGRVLTVRRFEVYNNVQRAMKVGEAGVMQSFQIEGCEDGFDLASNPENHAAVIIWVDVDLDGKRISDKLVQVKPEENSRGNIRTAATRERIRSAFTAAVNRIVQGYTENGP